MPRPFVIESTVYIPSPVIPGLPRLQAYDALPHGTATTRYTGRKLDAFAHACAFMRKQAVDYSPNLDEAYSFSCHTGELRQRLAMSFDNALVLVLEQQICGFPIGGKGLWPGKLGVPVESPILRTRRRHSLDDMNGLLEPMPLRMFIAPAGNNKQRVWRVHCDGMPDAYCIFAPDGTQHFIHVAYLLQLLLSTMPDKARTLLHLNF